MHTLCPLLVYYSYVAVPSVSIRSFFRVSHGAHATTDPTMSLNRENVPSSCVKLIHNSLELRSIIGKRWISFVIFIHLSLQ